MYKCNCNTQKTSNQYC